MAAKAKKWEKTKYIGIEKRDDGKYRVMLDYGNVTDYNAKTGEQILKDVVKVYWERNKWKYAESSLSSIEHHLRVINEYLGDIKIKDINKNKVEDFCNYIYEKRGLGYKSIVKIKSTLSNVFAFSIGAPEIYGIERNPCRLPDLNIKAPKPKKGVNKYEPRPMTEKDKMLIKDVVIKGEHCQNVNKDCTKDGAFRYVARPKILTKIIEYCMEQTASLQGYRSIKDSSCQ